MSDWLPELSPDYWDHRHAWLATKDGTIVIGDTGVLHDDLAVDNDIDEDEIAARGEVNRHGHVTQLAPAGNDYDDEVAEKFDDMFGDKYGMGHVSNDWTPDVGDRLRGTNNESYNELMKNRVPFWMDYNDPANPDPDVQFGEPGTFHPHPLPEGYVKGEVDTGTTPPRVTAYGHDSYGWHGHNIGQHVMRHWTQKNDNPEERLARIIEAVGKGNCVYCGMRGKNWMQAPPTESGGPGGNMCMCDSCSMKYQMGILTVDDLGKEWKKMKQQTLPAPTREEFEGRGYSYMPGWAPGEELYEADRAKRKQEYQQRYPEWIAKVGADWTPLLEADEHFWANRQPFAVHRDSGDVWIGEPGEHHDAHPWFEDTYQESRDGLAQDWKLGDIYNGRTNPYVPDEHSPEDLDEIDYQHKLQFPEMQKTADADSWSAPAMTNAFEGVNMDNSDMNENTPEHGNVGDNWVYINGKVAFGNDHSDTARTLGHEVGLAPTEVSYVSNLIARNTVPNDMEVAVGTMRGGYPQIWLSTVDRNHVWDVVMREREASHPESPAPYSPPSPTSPHTGSSLPSDTPPRARGARVVLGMQSIYHSNGAEPYETGWEGRTPWIYDGLNGILHHGDPGSWHGSLHDGLTRHNYDSGLPAPAPRDMIRGAMWQNLTQGYKHQAYNTAYPTYHGNDPVRMGDHEDWLDAIGKHMHRGVTPNLDPETFHDAPSDWETWLNARHDPINWDEEFEHDADRRNASNAFSGPPSRGEAQPPHLAANGPQNGVQSATDVLWWPRTAQNVRDYAVESWDKLRMEPKPFSEAVDVLTSWVQAQFPDEPEKAVRGLVEGIVKPSYTAGTTDSLVQSLIRREAGVIAIKDMGYQEWPDGDPAHRFIAYDGQTEVGHIDVAINFDGEQYIDNVYVDEQHRRQGIASQLLASARAALGDIKHDDDHLSDDGAAWRQTVGHSTDRNWDIRNEPPACPTCGDQLEIHFEGGASCPRCKTEYELGHNDEIIPSDNTIDEMSKTWPDTLPWGEEGNDYYRTAMADRTGHPEIDALIEEFLKMPQGDWTTDDDPYETLRDPERSHGACQSVTEHFVEFAKSKGFKAYSTDTDLDEMGYQPTGQGGEIGFNDDGEMQYGHYPEHTIATIVLDDPQYPYGREFYIDFTATQYGYTDHPKVTSKVAGEWDNPEIQKMHTDYFKSRIPYIYYPDLDQTQFGVQGKHHDSITNRLVREPNGQSAQYGEIYGGKAWPYTNLGLEHGPAVMRDFEEHRKNNFIAKTANDDDWTPQLPVGETGRPWIIIGDELRVGDPDTHHDQWTEAYPNVPNQQHPSYDRERPMGKIWNRTMRYDKPGPPVIDCYWPSAHPYYATVERMWQDAVNNGGSIKIPENRPMKPYSLGSTDDLIEKMKPHLTPDLLHPKYKDNPKAHCYVATEALYHLLGGKDSGYVPTRLRTPENGVHWFLRGADGHVLDPTSDQFDTPPDYAAGRGSGFLTRDPSKRTKMLMDRMAAFEPVVLQGGGEVHFNIHDLVTGAPGSGREGMRGYIIGEEEDGTYIVQWYPQDSDPEWRKPTDLKPFSKPDLRLALDYGDPNPAPHEWDFDNTEIDGRIGRYPFVVQYDPPRVLFGPEGGSHQMIARHWYQKDFYGEIPNRTALGEIIDHPQGDETIHIMIGPSGWGDENPEIMQEVKQAWDSGENRMDDVWSMSDWQRTSSDEFRTYPSDYVPTNPSDDEWAPQLGGNPIKEASIPFRWDGDGVFFGPMGGQHADIQNAWEFTNLKCYGRVWPEEGLYVVWRAGWNPDGEGINYKQLEGFLQKEYGEQFSLTDDDAYRVASVRKHADYQGWSNWDTWNTKLMMDNERETHDASRHLVREGMGIEALRDWALEHIVGPSNKSQMGDAQEWNDTPEHDRLDYHYEDFKAEHGDKPGMMDMLHSLVGGPDVSDYQPDLIDPELVNWQEIYDSIAEENEENRRYDAGEPATWQEQSKPVDMDAPGTLTLPDTWSKVAKTTIINHEDDPASDIETTDDWAGRVPYAYDRRNDILHWGLGGEFHNSLDDRAKQWYDEHKPQFPNKPDAMIWGAVARDPQTQELQHAIWRRPNITPEHIEKMEAAAGASIRDDWNPDTLYHMLNPPTKDDEEWTPRV